jgi:hypothetical protein
MRSSLAVSKNMGLEFIIIDNWRFSRALAHLPFRGKLVLYTRARNRTYQNHQKPTKISVPTMAVCFWSLTVVIINSGILARRISLGNEAIFTSFLLHFQKVQVSRDRLLWMTLKPIAFCEVQLCTGYLLSESDWRLKIKAAGLYVRFGASEFNSKFCNRRSCS